MIGRSNAVGGNAKWFSAPITWEENRISTRVGGGINRYGSAEFDIPDGTFGFICVPTSEADGRPSGNQFCFISNYRMTAWVVQSNPGTGGMFEIRQVSVADNHVSLQIGVDMGAATSPLYVYPITQSF